MNHNVFFVNMFFSCSFLERCLLPFGSEDGRLLDQSLTASSWLIKHEPERARLNQPSGHGRVGAWCTRVNNGHQWLQVNLGKVTKVTGCATQGRYDANQWVTRYRISYSKDCRRFYPYKRQVNFILTSPFASYSLTRQIRVPFLVCHISF